MPPTNSEKYVTWKAYWKGAVASIAVVVTILIAIAAAHTSRIHKGAVSIESLKEHATTAREERKAAGVERKEIIKKIDHIESSVHKVEMKQAVMIEKLDAALGLE